MKKFLLLCCLKFINATEIKDQFIEPKNSNMITENPKGTKRNCEESDIASKNKLLKTEVNNTSGMYLILYRVPSTENLNDTVSPLTTHTAPQNRTNQEISGIDLLIQASEIIQEKEPENCNKVNENIINNDELEKTNNTNVIFSKITPLPHKSSKQQNSHGISDLLFHDIKTELLTGKISNSNNKLSPSNPCYKSTIFLDLVLKDKVKKSFEALLSELKNPKNLTEEMKIILFFEKITKIDPLNHFDPFFDISFPIERSSIKCFSSYTTKLIDNPTLYIKYSLNFYFKSLEYCSNRVLILDLENFISNNLFNYKILFRRYPRANFLDLTEIEKKFTLFGMKKYELVINELSFISLILPEIKEILQIVITLIAGSSVIVFVKSMLHITLKFIFDVKELYKLLNDSGSYNFKAELFRYRTFLFFGCAGLIHLFLEIKKQFILYLISYIDLLNEDLLNEPQLENTIKNVIIEGGSSFYKKSIENGSNIFKFLSMKKAMVREFDKKSNMFDFEITANDTKFIKELVKEHKDFVANFLNEELKSKIEEIYEEIYKE